MDSEHIVGLLYSTPVSRSHFVVAKCPHSGSVISSLSSREFKCVCCDVTIRLMTRRRRIDRTRLAITTSRAVPLCPRRKSAVCVFSISLRIANVSVPRSARKCVDCDEWGYLWFLIWEFVIALPLITAVGKWERHVNFDLSRFLVVQTIHWWHDSGLRWI